MNNRELIRKLNTEHHLDAKDWEQLFETYTEEERESAAEMHYSMLHPENLKLSNRKRCLRDLKEIGYQTGCGIMVGSPGQTPAALAKDMLFMEAFQPEMIGVGPFLPHKDTPFKDKERGSVSLTLFILALCRIMLPNVHE